MKPKKVKVNIHCNRCGERFTLRGRVTPQGKVETGFKRCLCSNQDDFEVVQLPD